MRRTLIAALVVALTALLVPGASTGLAATATSTKRAPERGSASDIVQTPPDVRAKIRRQGAAAVSRTARAMTLALAQKGEIRTWLGLDDVAGSFYTKNYRLRGIGEHIEVWTAAGSRKFNGVRSTGLRFQRNDC
ncbi:MAG TPA: hypothetical protein VFW51_08565, partial [Actinomycetota bacterium]|nr:hypothetical protein [Actinomycetota bacterium]